MDLVEISLRGIGAFYAFAGYVATRAALTSLLVDRAIAAIAAQKPAPAETARAAWLLVSASLVLAGGLLLALLVDLAVWVFLASALGQALYLFVLAPRYFDVAEPPDEEGRRQTTNASVVYLAATAYVVWAAVTGRLVGWREVPWPLLAAAGALLAAHVAYVIRHAAGPRSRGTSPLLAGVEGDGAGDGAEDMQARAQSKRVKVMADYDAHPLWALDDGLYGDFPPEALALSPELTADLRAWADAYAASLNGDDPAASLWSEAQHRAHEEAGRPLALRLARERPDLTVFVYDRTSGIVEVHGEEAG